MELADLEKLERRAQAGSFRAMRRLGDLYMKGGAIGALWIPKDEQRARQLLEAAKKGKGEALRRALDPSLFRQNISVAMRNLPNPTHALRSVGRELLDDMLPSLGRILLLTAAVCLAVATFVGLVALLSEGVPRAVFAVAHVVGAILSVLAFWFFLLFFSSWQIDRRKKQVVEETALALRVTPEELDRVELTPAVFKLYADRFSGELLRNRFSDLCGSVLTGWDWLGMALQVGILVGVIWFTFTEDVENGAGAWFTVGAAVFFWLIGLVFTQLCRLLTGRYPGEAKHGRRMLVELNRQLHSR